MQVTVNTTSSGAAPSGTVTFFANGTAIGGTTSYYSSAGGAGYSASLQANLSTSNNAFPAAGSYTITTYNADANYSDPHHRLTTFPVLYPAPLCSGDLSQTVSYGNPATIAALVDTGSKAVYPTGTVTFIDENTNATISGPTACTNVKDTSGNYACQATTTFTVTSGDPITVRYGGDSNFPAASAPAFITMPDFLLSPQGGVQVTAGQSQNIILSISSINGLSGTVGNFACSGLPAETTCSFSPAQVTLSSTGSVTTTLTVTTTALGHRAIA